MVTVGPEPATEAAAVAAAVVVVVEPSSLVLTNEQRHCDAQCVHEEGSASELARIPFPVTIVAVW